MVPECPEGFFRLFVYGTLKRGFVNHERFCASAIQIRTAQIRGRLFETPWGHPVVELSTHEVLVHGSADPEWDWSCQRALAKVPASEGNMDPKSIQENPLFTLHARKDVSKSEKPAGWVQGELLDFLNPRGWLAELDHFEEFDPAVGLSRFERVLVRAYLADSVSIPAWVYAGAGILEGHDFPEVVGGRWL
jgi:gamma-glutamylcyclotransferase (GGCT)/AIG2-like uncharacterized protein YtfP